ncbi:MAG: sodium:proton antiporter [Alphaproteobacteria bacterium]|jgi:Na+/H+ antiporter NhaD/arsenite permease-like protein|nr:sodium:proton antiporter [Alphaproteobacteria bacterium]MBP9877238.1 sodium:proton antiporter [Alphaproteobacteria bacterium]
MHQFAFPVETMGLLWGIPFAGILLSIGLFPLFAPKIWHHHYGKIALAWALCFVMPAYFIIEAHIVTHHILATFLHDYLPFIILLFALFTVTGGIRIVGNFVGTPIINTALLMFGSFLASIMGTTGASILLIRPFIKANQYRNHKVHVIVFFIFLISNIGGSLTPIGDPPLFLGYLQGVSFFWPTSHLLKPMLFMVFSVLVIFFIVDTYFFSKEDDHPKKFHQDTKLFYVEGKWNFIPLVAIILLLFLGGKYQTDQGVMIFDVMFTYTQMVVNGGMILIALFSLWITHEETHRLNDFNWEPLLEVAKIFFGIFMTIIPVLAMLKAGEKGAFHSLIALVNRNGEPDPLMYFWLTGTLSSFLDNAPTYLVFFNATNAHVTELMTTLSQTLVAISAGAVFMGAMTYIGNAPNFMVKSIAEHNGIKMPGFFSYMFIACITLLPLFVLLSYIFFI